MGCKFEVNGKWYEETQLKELYESVITGGTAVDELGAYMESTVGVKYLSATEKLAGEEQTLNQIVGSEGSTASAETVKKVTEWLKKAGVDLKETPYIAQGGKAVDANGRAKLLESVVEIVQGKDNVALVEEAMHFATFIIQQTNPALYRKMLNSIDRYDIYKEVFDTYKNDPLYQIGGGKPNVPKIKFEAIGKVLAEHFINIEEGSTNRPELLEMRTSWIQSIIDWFKNLFNKHGNPFEEAVKALPTTPVDIAPLLAQAETLANKIRPNIKEAFMKEAPAVDLLNFVFDQAETNASSLLKTYLNGDTELLKEIRNFVRSNTFLQINAANENLIKKLDDTATTVVNKPLANGDNDYFVGAVKVYQRVTRYVKDQMAKRFKGRGENLLMDDQKKEWGKRGHKDMENLLGRYLTSEGKIVKNAQGQIVPQTTDTIKSELDVMGTGLFDSLHQYVVDLLLSYPEGTVFRTEQTIYSDRGGKAGERDIAGTMDFIAIQPDGKRDILDWKFIELKNKEQGADIQFYKQDEWKMQMDEYKKILKRDYGLKNENFGKTRMIPIVLTYNRSGEKGKVKLTPEDIEIGGVNLTIDSKAYLLPVVTSDESTGNDKLDSLVRSLVNLYNSLSKIAAPDRQKNIKAEQLNNLFKAIRHLQVAQNFGPLTEQVGILIKESERIIKEHKDKFENIKDLTEKQISAEAANLLLKAHALHIYQNLNIEFKNFYGDNPTEAENAIIAKLDKVTEEARHAYFNINTIVREFVNKYVAERRGVEGILKAEKTIAGLERPFGTTSELDTAAIQTLYLMVDRANNQAQFDLAEVRDELVALKKEVDAWGGLKKALPLIKKKDENKLIDEYDEEFYAQLKEAMESDDLDWMKSNLDMPALTQHLKERYTDVKKIIDENRYSYDDTENAIKKAEALKKLALTTDPTKIETFTDKDQYYILKKFPKEDWRSEEYKALKKEEPVFKFYEFIRKWNQKARELGYLEGKNAERNFLPYLYKSFSEKINLGGMDKLFSGMGDALMNSLTIDENVAGYGSFNELTGQLEDKVPTYFTGEIEKKEQTSEDLFVNMAAYIRAVINYEHKSEIDGQVRALYFVEKNKESLRVNTFGNLIKINGMVEPQKTNDKNADLFLNHMKAIHYGQKYTNVEATDALLGDWGKNFNKFSTAVNKKLGFDILPKMSEGKQVSLTRLMDKFNRIFTVKNMGLNVATSVSVFAGGNFQAIINSGKYYTERELLASEFQHASHYAFGNKALHTALIKAFMPIDEELNRELSKLATGKLTDRSFADAMMFLMRKGDYIVQYANFLAFMRNTIVLDGKLYNAREYYRNSEEYSKRYEKGGAVVKQMEADFDNKVQELLGKHGITTNSKVDSKGNLKIEGIPDIKNDNVFEYRTLIHSIGKAATGNVSPENEMMIRMNAIFRSMLVFKNWIPGLVKQRVGGLKFDSSTKTYHYGRLRMLIKTLGPLALFRINDITNILKANDKGIALMKEFFKNQKESHHSKTNKDLNMSEAEYMDMYRQNLSSQIKELGILVSMMAIMMAILPLFKPDDDEEMEVKNKFKFASRLLDKVRDEVSFYYDPRGMQQILNGSIFPALGIFTDASKVIGATMTEIYGLTVGGEEITDKNFVLKNWMKALPLTRELTYYIAMFDADLAKELGIQISSQSRMK